MWLIQNNLNFEVGIDNIKKILKDNNIELVEIDIYKNDENMYIKDTFDKFEPKDTSNIFVLGSYRLSRMATERSFHPGSFSNEHFNYASWTQHWTKDNMLNGEYLQQKVTEIKIPDHWESVFARPLEDDKLITGGLFKKEDLLMALEKKVTENHKDKYLILSEPKTILAEYRFFVIDKKVITGSLYKIRGQLITSDSIDPEAMLYAQQMVDLWTPSTAFVIDIALTDKGPKIIEVNNISSAGLYKSDVSKLVISMEVALKKIQS